MHAERAAKTRNGGPVEAPCLAHDCGALHARARVAAARLSLQDAEEIVKDGPASLLRDPPGGSTAADRALLPFTGGKVPIRGRLYLTQLRLVFLPSGVGAVVSMLDIPLRDLAAVSTARVGWRSAVRVTLRNGREHDLLARGVAGWAASVGRAAGLGAAPPG